MTQPQPELTEAPAAQSEPRGGQAVSIARGRRRALGVMLASLAGVPLLGACNQLVPPRDLKAPSLSISGLSVDSIARDSITLRLMIEARNPNSVEMPLSDFRFDFSVLGQPVAHGAVSEQTFTLPAQGERQLPLLLKLNGSDVLSLVRRLVTGSFSEIGWEMKGSARWGISPFALPFEKRGTLGLRALLDAVGR